MIWTPSAAGGDDDTDPGGSSERPLVRDYDPLGRLARVAHPSGRRTVAYRYRGATSQLDTAAFDRTDVRYRYSPDGAETDWQRAAVVDALTGSRIGGLLDVGYGPGRLVTSQNVTTTSTTGTVTARFRYAYDNHFRLSRLEAGVGPTQLPAFEFSYSVDTGRVERLGPLAIRYSSGSETRTPGTTVVRDSNVVVSVERDGTFGRPTDWKYTFNNYIVFSMEVSYSLLVRIVSLSYFSLTPRQCLTEEAIQHHTSYNHQIV